MDKTEDMSQVCEDFTYQITSGQITINRRRETALRGVAGSDRMQIGFIR
jgi:hypothetical protein